MITTEVLDELNQHLVEYNEKYTATRLKFEQLEKHFPDKLATIKCEISSLRQKLQDVENSTIATARIMDAHLTQLIGKVKSLRESMNKRVSAYNPVLDLLKGMFLFLVLNYSLLIFPAVQANVEMSIYVLCEGESIDIFEGGKAFLMQVNWLLGYHGTACEQIEISSQYLAVSNMRAIRIS